MDVKKYKHRSPCFSYPWNEGFLIITLSISTFFTIPVIHVLNGVLGLLSCADMHNPELHSKSVKF